MRRLKLITIYTKSGSVQGNNAVTFILKSQKHRWTKAHKINCELPKNQFSKCIALDAINVSYALKHVRDKYRKKKVVVYNDSEHVASATKKKNGEYEKNTNISAIEDLRDIIGSFNNVHVKKFPAGCKYHQELEHILIECALDSIEINEKD